MSIPPFTTDRFVDEEGELVRHFVGKKCFCIMGNGQPDPNCDMHERGGYRYTKEQPITGLVSQVKFDRKLLELGIVEPGDCVFSPLSTDTVSEDDKIVFTWPLPHGSGDVFTRCDDEYDVLTYEAARSIDCEDENGVEYTENVDFRFDGKKIVWQWEGKEGNAPALGTRYAVKYMGFIEWIAFCPPSTRISHGEDIGAKVFLRKKHLVFG